MPIIKSAKKRVRVAEKAAIRNAKTKRFLKSAVKSFNKAVGAGDAKTADESFRQSQSGLDKALKKRLLHQNKVARLKRQLAAKAKALSGQAGGKAPEAAASAAKKSAKPGNTKAADTPTKKAATASKKPAAGSAAKRSAVKKAA